MSARSRAISLAAILLVAAGARIWGIGYGLPWLFYFHDEPQVVLRALRFGTGDLNPHFFIWPGTLLLYLAFVAYAGLFVFGKLAGWWAGKEGFAAAYFGDPSPFYLLPRVTSVAFGVWTVWLARGLGAAAYSEAVGMAVALGLAINAMHAHYSHLAHPVTAMTACTVLGLWLAWRAASGGAPRHLYLAAAVAGVGATAQYHAALLALPAAVALGYRVAEARGAERARWIRHGALAGLLAAAAFLAVSPYVVLDYRTFRADLAWITAKTSGGAGGGSRGWADGLAAFWTACLRPALHLPLALLAGTGVLLALARRTRADVILLTYAAGYVLIASRAGVLNDRYAIPLLVPALILAARAGESALARLGAGPPARAWAVPLAIGVITLPSALELIETDYTMTREDTRVVSLRWFESHVPENERVVIDMLRFWNSMSPPLAENRARLEERLAEVARGLSGAGHSAAYAEYYRYRLEHPRRPGYYLRSTDAGAAVAPLDSLLAQGFRWAVVSEEATVLQPGRAAAGDSSGIRYYRELERRAARVAGFEPRRWVRRGPRITIYRLDPAAAR